jgi:hypothetical protein
MNEGDVFVLTVILGQGTRLVLVPFALVGSVLTVEEPLVVDEVVGGFTKRDEFELDVVLELGVVGVELEGDELGAVIAKRFVIQRHFHRFLKRLSEMSF